jgi:tripartite-type tricarboxylate transporter receptor subunit TctC
MPQEADRGNGIMETIGIRGEVMEERRWVSLLLSGEGSGMRERRAAGSCEAAAVPSHRSALRGAFAAVVLAAAAHVMAGEPQKTDYPARPVRVIVGFAPGGSDVPARMLAQKLSDKLGQPFVVDNRPGASGVLGTEITSKAPPDGHTLNFMTASHAVTPAYYEKLPYDPIKDFASIGSVGSVPFTLAVHPSMPVKNVKEFVALAKSKPGQLNYASPGTGSIGHLANELLAKQTGIKVTHVAYKGTGPAATAVLAGEVHFMMPNLIGALPHARAGKLKLLAIADEKRSPQSPETPTLAEAGVKGAESGTWYGILAPRGTPEAIVQFLNREVNAQLESQALRDQFASIGVTPRGGTPAEFMAFVKSEIDKWGAVAEYAGMTRQKF